MHFQISRTAFVELGACHGGRNVAKFNKNIFLFAKKMYSCVKKYPYSIKFYKCLA